MLSLLLERGAAGDKERKQAGQIQRSAKEMATMIRELLEYTRTQLGKGIPVKPKACSLLVICRDAVDEVRAARPDRQFLTDVPEDLAGWVDDARLRQALSNLLNNALQHGDPDSPVSLQVRAEGQELVLSVKNLGEPIPAESLQVIFDPLVQLSARSAVAPETPSTNLGLGLYIAREVALGHHGTLDVTSDLENGTVFTMRLPLGRPVE
jgi:signal transduction histidine kinase